MHDCREKTEETHHDNTFEADLLQAHSGPLIATLAGSMTVDKVELPAVTERPMPAPFAQAYRYLPLAGR